MVQTLNQILSEKCEWKKNFDAMPVSGNCDAKCGKPATHWFGNTSRATCGFNKCIDVMCAERDAMVTREDEE